MSYFLSEITEVDMFVLVYRLVFDIGRYFHDLILYFNTAKQHEIPLQTVWYYQRIFPMVHSIIKSKNIISFCPLWNGKYEPKLYITYPSGFLTPFFHHCFFIENCSGFPQMWHLPRIAWFAQDLSLNILLLFRVTYAAGSLAVPRSVLRRCLHEYS